MSSLLKGSLTAACFRIDTPVSSRITPALCRMAFAPINPESEDERAAGAVEFDNSNSSEFAAPSTYSLSHYTVFNWRVDRLKVPARALRKALLEWATGFEAKNGRRPGRVERAEAKVLLKRSLRAKQEPVTKLYPVVIDLKAQHVYVFATSAGTVDEVQACIESALEVRLQHRAVDQLMRAQNELSQTIGDAEGARAAMNAINRVALARAALTWLLFMSEATAPIVDSEDSGDAPVISFFGKAALCGIGDPVATARVTGTKAPYAPLVKQALKRGLLIDSARVKVVVGEVEYLVTLDTGFTLRTLRAMKLPAALMETDDDRLTERLNSVAALAGLVERLVRAFVTARTSPEWTATVAAMLEWMDGEQKTQEPSGITLEGWAKRRAQLREENGRCARCGEEHATSECDQ